MSRAVNLSPEQRIIMVDVSMFDGYRYFFWSFVGEGFDLETLYELRSIEEADITTGEGGRRASELSEAPVPGTAMGDTPESATVQTVPECHKPARGGKRRSHGAAGVMGAVPTLQTRRD